MKRIFYIAYICVILYTFSLIHLDAGSRAFFVWEEHAALTRITKPVDLSKGEFLEMLEETASRTDTVISYELLEDRGSETTVKFYTTDGRRYDFGDKISVYGFYELEPYNLEACAYYVKSSKIEAFYDELEQSGIYYRIIDGDVRVKRYFCWNNMFLPVSLLSVSFLFLAQAHRKTFVVKRMMGYGVFHIACDFLLSVFGKLSIITLAETALIYAACRFFIG